jgi:hypothetical protein
MLCLYTGDLLRLVMMMVIPGLNVVDVSPLGYDDVDVVQSSGSVMIMDDCCAPIGWMQVCVYCESQTVDAVVFLPNFPSLTPRN